MELISAQHISAKDPREALQWPHPYPEQLRNSWRTPMKTLIAVAATLVLSAPVVADNSQSSKQDGKGLYPQWLINHEG